MATITEGTRAENFIVQDLGWMSRETVVVAQNQTLAAGTVLGKVTASGQYVILAPAAADGSQTAAGISLNKVTTGAGQTAEAAILARLATVNLGELVWPGGITTPQRTAAIAQLAAINIMARAAI